MMKQALLLLLLLAAIHVYADTHLLPERARGGLLWKLMHHESEPLQETLNDDDDHASSWEALVDNWDPSQGTYKQRYFVNDRYFDKHDPQG